jgi:polyhydroxybutyrate depolymerase
MKPANFWLIAALCTGSSVFGAEPAPTKWTVDSVEREALVYLPSSAPKSKPPVILAFHGHGGNMHFAARGMAFQNSWPEAIVVYLQGLPTPGIVMDLAGEKPGWQREAGQEHDRDLKFVDAILATLREKYSCLRDGIFEWGIVHLFASLTTAECVRGRCARRRSLTAAGGTNYSAAGSALWREKRPARDI